MVIENFVSLTNAACLTNAVTELIVGDSATVEHVKFQDESHQAFHISTLAATFGAPATLPRTRSHSGEAFAHEHLCHARRRGLGVCP
jgi:alkyl hydroperoxide reductase subunit AhpF